MHVYVACWSRVYDCRGKTAHTSGSCLHVWYSVCSLHYWFVWALFSLGVGASKIEQMQNWNKFLRVCILHLVHFSLCKGISLAFLDREVFRLLLVFLCSICNAAILFLNCVSVSWPSVVVDKLQGRQKGRLMGEEALRKEKELINEVRNMEYINKEAKQCPSCRIAVQKSEGCNKMTCTNCGNFFCFKCGRSITGYEHFR